MLYRPDFIIIGGPSGDGVELIASKTVRNAEFSYERNYDTVQVAYGEPITRVMSHERMSIKTIIGDMVSVRATDYHGVWETLFKVWTPERARYPELEGQKAIERY